MKIVEKLLDFFKLKEKNIQPEIHSFDDIFNYNSVSFNIAGKEYDIMKKEDKFLTTPAADKDRGILVFKQKLIY